MLSQIHETHTYPSPLLPFIFHRDMGPSPQYGMVNWHTNIELLYVRSGEGFVLYEGEEIAMNEGDTVIINTNCLHSLRSNPDSPLPFFYDCLIIDREFCIQNGADTTACHFVSHFHDVAMGQRMDDLRKSWDTGISSVVAVRAAVLSILAHILTKTTGNVTPPAPDASSKTITSSGPFAIWRKTYLSRSRSPQRPTPLASAAVIWLTCFANRPA